MNAHRLNRRILIVAVSVCVALPLMGATHIATSSKDRLPSLSVEVTQTQVRIAGAQPHQRVLLVGYSRWRQDYIGRLQRDRAYLIADAEGIASLTPGSGVRPDSVWVAVDIQTGRYGSAAPVSSPMREIPIGEQALRKEKGRLKKLMPQLRMAYFVMVRPGEGAWEKDAGGGVRDDRVAAIEGRTEISLDGLKPIGSSPAAPGEFRAGDLLLVFSPENGMFSSIRPEH